MKYYLLLLSLFAIIVTSCSKKDTPPPIVLKSITLGKDTLIMYVGDTRTLSVTLDPSSIDKATLSWNSSDPTVFSVTNAGVLTAHKAGAAILTVGNSGKTVTATALVTVNPPIPPTPPVDSLKVGLIAYYPFDHTSAIDSSGNGHNGMLFNISSVPNRFGKANSAYYFNGTNSYVKIPDSQDLRLSNTDFTINVWEKLEAYDASFGSSLLSKRIYGNDNGWLLMVRGNLAVKGTILYGPGAESTNANGNIVVGLNEWHMVTCVYNLSGKKLSIYIDGVLDNTTNGIVTSNGAISAPLYFGIDNATVDGAVEYNFKGNMDDIRIYNRKLSLSDINKLYTN